MGMKPNPHFRHNPKRAIFVNGPIDSKLLHNLSAKIIGFQSEDRSPITVYIDSPGGELSSATALWKLLTSPTQDNPEPCHIITVVTTRAASAAADLLSSGDFALAHSHSTILFHGSRMNMDRPMTLENTSFLAQYLRYTNDKYAMDLLKRIEDRFMRRFIFSRRAIEEIRKITPGKKLTDADCFLALLKKNLTTKAQVVYEEACKRRDRYQALISAVLKKSPRSKSRTKTEAVRIKSIIDFERENNKKNKSWTFEFDGLKEVNDDFFLINEYLSISESDRINLICKRWGKSALSSEEKEKMEKFADEKAKDKFLIKKVRPRLIPLWTFFVALCHALQEGENELTAKDAYWFGLIDEIIGDSATAVFRKLLEYTPDPSKEEIPNSPEAVGQKKIA